MKRLQQQQQNQQIIQIIIWSDFIKLLYTHIYRLI